MCNQNTYGLASTVGADYEGERLEEGDDVLIVRIEAPNPLDQHLIHGAHLAPRAPGASLPPRPALLLRSVPEQLHQI